MILPRSELNELNRLLSTVPVVVVLGPRLCGKTTLARQTQHTAFFDLSTPETAAMFSNPMDSLRRIDGLVVLDEVHRMPEILRTVARLGAEGQRFLLVGWATESLSSSIRHDIPPQHLRILPLLGFRLFDVGVASQERLWLRGGLPSSFLAPDEQSSFEFRREYVSNFVGADVDSYKGFVGKSIFRRFLEYIAQHQGSVLSLSMVAAETGLSASIIARYLDLLEQAYIVRRLPWFSRRRNPPRGLGRLYLRDSGLLHALLGISAWVGSGSSRYQGISWEGFALETVLSLMPWNARVGFYRDLDGGEVDLIAEVGDRSWGFEFCLSADHAEARERAVRRLLPEVERMYLVHPQSEHRGIGPKQEIIPLALMPAAIQDLAQDPRLDRGIRTLPARSRREQPSDKLAAHAVRGNRRDTSAPRRPTSGASDEEDSMKVSLPRRAEELRGHTDVGILTVRQDEFDAVVARFRNHEPVSGGKNSYECAAVKTLQGQARVVITRAVEKANDEAQAIARNMIDDIDPKWILLVGIGGGMPDHEYTLGDVLLGSRFTDFSVSAALEEGRVESAVSGGAMHVDVNALLQTLSARTAQLGRWNSKWAIAIKKPHEVVPKTLTERFAKKLYGRSIAWKKKVHQCLFEHFSCGVAPRKPRFWVGPLATSNILVKDTTLARRWRQAARDVVGVEMELGGVYKAARYGGKQDYRVLAIRGISDIIGYERSHSWTSYACNVAASFAYALVTSGLLSV